MANDNRIARYFNNYMNGILPNFDPYDYSDKDKCNALHVSYMLDRTQSMFEWSNLPDTIPARSLELYLQMNGHCCYTEVDGKPYVFTGGMGGEPDPYYMPTIYTVANPALKFSKSLRIGEDCIVIPNDSMYVGLLPLCMRYASALTENELSLNIASINSRILSLISAPDDRSYESAKKYLEDIIAGKYGVIGDNAFLEGVKTQPYSTSGSSNIVYSLIEYEQYIKGSWYNELGLDANYNMKRETLNKSEIELNNDALFPLVDDMLNTRKLAVDKINSKYGTNISVKLGSSWEDNVKEIEAQQEEISGQPENHSEGGEYVDDERDENGNIKTE